jgi:hypothetical protein
MDLHNLLVLITAFGTVGFLIKLVLLLTGGDAGEDLHHEDLDFGDSSTKAFLVLSTQTIFAALMVGGLFGLTAMDDLQDSVTHVLGYTALGVFVGGSLSAFIMRALRKLNSVPQKPVPKVGDVGTAYIPISADNGEVVLNIGGRQEEFEAISEHGQIIRAFAQVQVVGKLNNKLVVTDQIREA